MLTTCTEILSPKPYLVTLHATHRVCRRRRHHLNILSLLCVSRFFLSVHTSVLFAVFFCFFCFERPISYSNDPDTSRSSQSAVCLSAVCFIAEGENLGDEMRGSQRGRNLNLNLDQVSGCVGSDLRQTHAAVFYPLKARRRLKI